uniref:Uncharacterized protein n=1 Tax=Meloidogyne floridensis TaxID=298350 RepID=A0A915PA72_9BILA
MNKLLLVLLITLLIATIAIQHGMAQDEEEFHVNGAGVDAHGDGAADGDAHGAGEDGAVDGDAHGDGAEDGEGAKHVCS